jgi:hypothetical protein
VERLWVEHQRQLPRDPAELRVLRRDALLRQRHRHRPGAQSHSGNVTVVTRSQSCQMGRNFALWEYKKVQPIRLGS